jgi:hypothetical protein
MTRNTSENKEKKAGDREEIADDCVLSEEYLMEIREMKPESTLRKLRRLGYTCFTKSISKTMSAVGDNYVSYVSNHVNVVEGRKAVISYQCEKTSVDTDANGNVTINIKNPTRNAGSSNGVQVNIVITSDGDAALFEAFTGSRFINDSGIIADSAKISVLNSKGNSVQTSINNTANNTDAEKETESLMSEQISEQISEMSDQNYINLEVLSAAGRFKGFL